MSAPPKPGGGGGGGIAEPPGSGGGGGAEGSIIGEFVRMGAIGIPFSSEVASVIVEICEDLPHWCEACCFSSSATFDRNRSKPSKLRSILSISNWSLKDLETAVSSSLSVKVSCWVNLDSISQKDEL